MQIIHTQHHDARLVLGHQIRCNDQAFVTEPSFGEGKGILLSLSGKWLDFKKVPKLSELSESDGWLVNDRLKVIRNYMSMWLY